MLMMEKSSRVGYALDGVDGVGGGPWSLLIKTSVDRVVLPLDGYTAVAKPGV